MVMPFGAKTFRKQMLQFFSKISIKRTCTVMVREKVKAKKAKLIPDQVRKILYLFSSYSFQNVFVLCFIFNGSSLRVFFALFICNLHKTDVKMSMFQSFNLENDNKGDQDIEMIELYEETNETASENTQSENMDVLETFLEVEDISDGMCMYNELKISFTLELNFTIHILFYLKMLRGRAPET